MFIILLLHPHEFDCLLSRMLENEASGHKKMWEEEVKGKSKLAFELARVDRERRNAVDMLESYKKKISRANRHKIYHNKKHQTDYEEMEEKLERYRSVSLCYYV